MALLPRASCRWLDIYTLPFEKINFHARCQKSPSFFGTFMFSPMLDGPVTTFVSTSLIDETKVLKLYMAQS